MFRRRLIRIFCLFLLFASATLWPASHFWCADLGRDFGLNSLGLELGVDQIRLEWTQNRADPNPRWYSHLERIRPGQTELLDSFGHNLLGFGAGNFTIKWQDKSGPVDYSTRFVRIPFWFLTLASALLLVYAWRKTARTNPTGAFPIEPMKDEKSEMKNPKEPPCNAKIPMASSSSATSAAATGTARSP